MPPQEETVLSDAERALVQRVADQRGVTWEQAADDLRREGMAQRFRRGVRRAPAKVYPLRRPKL
jgi:GAF domain-containing protein